MKGFKIFSGCLVWYTDTDNLPALSSSLTVRGFSQLNAYHDLSPVLFWSSMSCFLPPVVTSCVSPVSDCTTCISFPCVLPSVFFPCAPPLWLSWSHSKLSANTFPKYIKAYMQTYLQKYLMHLIHKEKIQKDGTLETFKQNYVSSVNSLHWKTSAISNCWTSAEKTDWVLKSCCSKLYWPLFEPHPFSLPPVSPIINSFVSSHTTAESIHYEGQTILWYSKFYYGS